MRTESWVVLVRKEREGRRGLTEILDLGDITLCPETNHEEHFCVNVLVQFISNEG
jgi:hypothetical protein